MARIRSLKPEFWDSPGTAKASLRTRLLFMAMWNWADDYGVGDATPGRLINFAFPHDEISVADFPRMLSEVSKSYEVVFFTFRNRPFYVIPSWDTHQRNERRAKVKVELYDAAEAAIAAASSVGSETSDDLHGNSVQLRGASGTGTGEQGNRGTGESLVTYVSGEISEAPAKPTPSKKKGTRISGPDWMPQQKTVDRIKAAFPHISSEQLRNEHELFICWATSSASSNAVKLDWDATWSGWMRRELVKMRSHNGTNGKPHKLRALADLAAEVREMETTNGKALEA